MVALVSLDIEGAFDNAWWPAVLRELLNMGVNAQTMRVLSSYLRYRTVVVRYLGQKVLKKTTKGCVQGSIGGPLLWNVQLDPSLGRRRTRRRTSRPPPVISSSWQQPGTQQHWRGKSTKPWSWWRIEAADLN